MTKRSQPYRPRVFISYAARGTDAETAKALRDALVANKVRVPAWRDKEELQLGRRAIHEIEVGIAQCDFFLLLVSPRSVLKSFWCPREWSRADRLGKTIVPLILEAVAPEAWPLVLEEVQWLDIQCGLEKGMPELLRRLEVTTTGGGDIPDPADRDDRRMRALAHALCRFESMGAAWNVRMILSELGRDCMETERATQIVEGLRKPEIKTCKEASAFLTQAWEEPLPSPKKRQAR